MLRKMTMDFEMGTLKEELLKIFPDPKIAAHNLISGVFHDNFLDRYWLFCYREDFTTRQWDEYRVFSDGIKRRVSDLLHNRLRD